MKHRRRGSTTRQWLLSIVAIGLVLVVTIIVARTAPLGSTPLWTEVEADSDPLGGRSGAPAIAKEGVTVTLVAGDRTVRRAMPAVAFTLEPDQTLDARLPAGAFTADFEAVFRSGGVRRARLGAEIAGGSITIEQDGTVIAEGTGGADPLRVLSEEVPLGSRTTRLVYRVRSDGTSPLSLRAVWQPGPQAAVLPLPVRGATPLANEAVRGEMLAGLLNCAQCHAVDDATLADALAARTPPLLDDIGARATPEWLRSWIAAPHASKPDAAMPSLLHDRPSRDQDIEDLVHFLAGLGGPMDATPETLDGSLVATGMVAYHEVGCAACHGPLEPLDALPGGRSAGPAPLNEYLPLGSVAQKTNVRQLTAFLLDPFATRPGGTMPAMNLTELEAKAIASYLVDHTAADAAAPSGAFAVDADRASRGRALFAEVGCANCHAFSVNRAAIEPTLTAPPLASVGAAGGCIGETPTAGLPHYAMRGDDRAALTAFLAGLDERASEHVPLDALAVTLGHMNCLACHEWYGQGGPESAVARYFAARGEVDLGEEGRLPPDLTNAGGRLNTGWMHDVLVDGATARPYMATRMPQFGRDNVGHLPELFTAASGCVATETPSFSDADATAGRQLVGNMGLNCIQCHDIAGRPSTGTPGPDLASMVERLHYDYFRVWLADPKSIREDTRMPTFFIDGVSGVTDVLEGRVDAQIGAIWSYLSLGEQLPLPDGLPDPGGVTLSVTDEPIVFRTFMNEAGVRAIACGYPEQVHCAFDATNCVVAAAWDGEFLDAGGAWNNRGGSRTDPDHISWTAPATPLLTDEHGGPGTPKFRGYRLDATRRPTLFFDLTFGDNVVRVEATPEPQRGGDGARMRVRYAITGPPGLRLLADPGGAGRLRSAGTETDAAVEIVLDRDGAASFEMEISW